MNIEKVNKTGGEAQRRVGIRRFVPSGLLLVVLLSGCAKELPEKIPAIEKSITLHFNMGISADATTKAPIIGRQFPVSPEGIISNIGICMMTSEGSAAYATGSDNTLAELTGKTGFVYTVRYQYNGTSTWMDELRFYVGQTVQVWGYYPHNILATTTAVPFDLTTVAEQGDQTDLMWSAPQTVAATASNASQAVSLSFKHAFALLEFTVRQDGADLATMTKVEVKNKTNSWVVNKGTLNPKTGDITGSNSGTVTCDFSQELTNDGVKIRVLIPPFNNDTYADGDIEVQFTDADGTTTPKPFRLKKEYLSGVSGKVGLTAGYTYGFNLLYSKGASGSLTLDSWTVNPTITEGIGVMSRAYMFYGEMNGTITTGMDGSISTSYNMYGVDGNSNGTCNNIEPVDTVFVYEPPYYRLEIAKEDELYSNWEDARKACWNKTTDNGGWRLPRVSELWMMYNNNTTLASVPGFNALGKDSYYWSSTEYNKDNSWDVGSKYTNATTKTYSNNVRCVREL